MVTPFSMNGYEVIFYKLDENLTADEDDLKSKMSDDVLVLYISYFGIEPFDKNFIGSLKIACPEAKFVEDKTHTPLEVALDSDADAVVISIRKWLAIADGGLVFSKDDFKSKHKFEHCFSDLRKNAMEKKSAFLQTGDEKLKDEFRRLLGEAGELLDASSDPYGMTAASEEQLKKTDFDRIFEQRIKNVNALKTGLQPLVDCGKMKFITSNPEKSTLYFPILVENRNDVQKALAEKSVYCPVIWPVPEQARNICPNSEYVADNMLAIPCDQRYAQEDMLRIVEIINTVI